MNPPRVSERDSIDFLVATPKVASACEAARCQPDDGYVQQMQERIPRMDLNYQTCAPRITLLIYC